MTPAANCHLAHAPRPLTLTLNTDMRCNGKAKYLFRPTYFTLFIFSNEEKLGNWQIVGQIDIHEKKKYEKKNKHGWKDNCWLHLSFSEKCKLWPWSFNDSVLRVRDVLPSSLPFPLLFTPLRLPCLPPPLTSTPERKCMENRPNARDHQLKKDKGHTDSKVFHVSLFCSSPSATPFPGIKGRVKIK